MFGVLVDGSASRRTATLPIGTVIRMATKTATKPAQKTAPKSGEKTVHTPELDAILTAVRTAVKTYDGKMKNRDRATAAALVAKVDACRAIIRLMADPATFASRGPSAGKPSVSIIAELLGYPRQSFTPLFKGAEALKAYYATLDADTVAAIMTPAEGEAAAAATEHELDLASVGLTSEADRARANRLKAKQGKPDTGKGKGKGDDTEGEGEGEGAPTLGKGVETPAPTYDAVVSATLALQSIVRNYCKEGGFSAVQAENLQETIREMSTLIESHRVDGGDV